MLAAAAAAAAKHTGGAASHSSDDADAWRGTHELALQSLLRLVATYGDAFRAVVNTRLPVELKQRLERAVEHMRQQQQEQQQQAAAAAAAAASQRSTVPGKKKKAKA
jgi:hypothetical protein